MSGVLLTVAFYALLRFKAVADGALGPDFTRTLLVIVGLASLLVAASLLLTQRDVKRMLAYHSIEHMGLIALGAAAGTTLAIAAVLLHILGHGIAKAVLFLASGEILLVEGTSEIERIPSLLGRRPLLGGIFGFGLVALLGLPPFSLFVSELNMIRGEVAVGLGWAAGLSLLAMAVIFAAVTAATSSSAGMGPPRRRRHASSGSPSSGPWWPAPSSGCPPGRSSRSCMPRLGSWSDDPRGPSRDGAGAHQRARLAQRARSRGQGAPRCRVPPCPRRRARRRPRAAGGVHLLRWSS
jgi:hydrogenase-4 component F